MRKIISLVLVVVMLMTVGSAAAFAEGVQRTSGPWDGFDWFFRGARISLYEDVPEDEPENDISIAEYTTEGFKVHNDAIAGATYDKASNTLTLNNFNHPELYLEVYYMGDDFTVRVEGSCSVRFIGVFNTLNHYSSSLNIVGTGSLKVNEDKACEVAVYVSNTSYSFAGDNKESWSGLNVADSVALDIYAGSGERQTLISVSGTSYDTADNAAWIGGSVEGLQSERMSNEENVHVPVALPESEGGEITFGYAAKSKTDPEGVYTASINNDEVGELEYYWVSKFILIPEYNLYTKDMSFGDGYGKKYSPEEFEKEFELDVRDEPKMIYFTSEWRENNAVGELGVKMTKADDPGALYIGVPSGTIEPYSFEDPAGYYISKVEWDEEQDIYVSDESLAVDYIESSQLADSGYEIVTEEAEVNTMFKCWALPAPYDEENFFSDHEVMKNENDPDALYVKDYTYEYSVEGVVTERGIAVNKPVLDEETGDYYLDPANKIEVPIEVFESGDSGFSYVTEMKDVPISVRFITSDYGIENYGLYGTLAEKDGDKGYVYTTYTREDNPDAEKYHDVFRITLDEATGLYFTESDDEYGEVSLFDGLTDEELAAQGFTAVLEPVPYELFFNGYAECSEASLYTDKNGKEFIKWYNNGYRAYSFDRSKTFNNNGTDYYLVNERPDVNPDDLTVVIKTEILNKWRYWLDGSEYHHRPSEAGGFTVSGSVSASEKVSADKSATVKLTGIDNDFVGLDDNAKNNYAIENVPAGTYKLEITKENHVTREYEITVTDKDVAQDVVICPPGDINGDGETDVMDATMGLRYIRKLRGLDEYQIKCGDVFSDGDGEVDVNDISRILRHVRKLKPLY